MQSYVTKTEAERLNTAATSALLKEIGTVLRNAREKKSFSIRDVREVTCIPIHHIIAIESGDRSTLPEDLYLIGFIKRFAKAVDVSEKTITEMISRERKYKSQGYESEAFDLLFNGQTKQNEEEHGEQKSAHTFLKVYHFYLLVGMILFVTALHMIFQSIKTDPNELKTASTLVVEDGKPVFVAMSKDKIAIEEEQNAKESDEIIVDEIKENENIQDMVEPDEEVSWGEVDQLNKKQAEIQNDLHTVKETQVVVKSSLKNIPAVRVVKNVVKPAQPKNLPKPILNKPIVKNAIAKTVLNRSKPAIQTKQTKLVAKIAEVKQAPLERNISLRPLRQQIGTEPIKQSDSIRLRPLVTN